MDLTLHKEQYFLLVKRFNRLNFSSIHPGLTQQEFYLLNLLNDAKEEDPANPGVNVSKLAEMMNQSIYVVSRILKNLEQRELIVRNTDPGNRRKTIVSLTEKGAALLEKANQRWLDFSEKINKDMGGDFQMFLEYAGRFASTLERYLKEYQED